MMRGPLLAIFFSLITINQLLAQNGKAAGQITFTGDSDEPVMIYGKAVSSDSSELVYHISGFLNQPIDINDWWVPLSVTSLEEFNGEPSRLIMLNPSNAFSLIAENVSDKPITIIHDLNGRLIAELLPVNTSEGNYQFFSKLQALSDGTYLVTIQIGDKSNTLRWVRQNGLPPDSKLTLERSFYTIPIQQIRARTAEEANYTISWNKGYGIVEGDSLVFLTDGDNTVSIEVRLLDVPYFSIDGSVTNADIGKAVWIFQNTRQDSTEFDGGTFVIEPILSSYDENNQIINLNGILEIQSPEQKFVSKQIAVELAGVNPGKNIHSLSTSVEMIDSEGFLEIMLRNQQNEIVENLLVTFNGNSTAIDSVFNITATPGNYIISVAPSDSTHQVFTAFEKEVVVTADTSSMTISINTEPITFSCDFQLTVMDTNGRTVENSIAVIDGDSVTLTASGIVTKAINLNARPDKPWLAEERNMEISVFSSDSSYHFAKVTQPIALTDGDVTSNLNISTEPFNWTATFQLSVSDTEERTVENNKVIINGEEFIISSSGEVIKEIFLEADPEKFWLPGSKTFLVEVFQSDYSYQHDPVSKKVTISTDVTDQIDISSQPFSFADADLTVIFKDGTNPIEGVLLEAEGKSAISNAEGVATILSVVPITESDPVKFWLPGYVDIFYDASKDGYQRIFGQHISLSSGNNNISIALGKTDVCNTGNNVLNPDLNYGSLTDIDGNTYKTIQIGEQIWMAENLKVTHYPDGTAIPQITGDYNWSLLENNDTDDAYCWYNDEPAFKDQYGAYYSYAAAKDACPEGWHLPTDTEWTELQDYLYESGYNWDAITSGNNIGKSLAATSGWSTSTTTGDVGNDQDSNNSAGFSALAGGVRDSGFGLFFVPGSFNYICHYGFWWSSTESNGNTAYGGLMHYSDPNMYISNSDKSYGLNVRCQKDPDITKGSVKLLIKNAEGNNQDIPGSKGKVELYKADVLVATQNTNMNGEVTFLYLEPGDDYKAFFYHDPGISAPNHTEYWGQKEITVIAGESTTGSFIRYMPYVAEEIKVYDGASDVSGTIVNAGTELTIVVKLKNDGESIQGKSNLILDRDKASSYDFEQLSANKILSSAGGITEFSFTFIPSEDGNYYYAMNALADEVDLGGYNVTDSRGWSDTELFTVGQKIFNYDLTYGSITDVDNNTYKTIIIGEQEWMAENLKVTHYPDGTSIPFVIGNTNWAALGDNNTDDAYCWYDDDETTYKDLYGALYTYAAALNACPTNWHLPSDGEWQDLEDYLIANGYNWDGTTTYDMTGKSLAAKSGWTLSSTLGVVGYEQESNNASGFSALPGGYRFTGTGSFIGAGDLGYWWSSTEYSDTNPYNRRLVYYYSDLTRSNAAKSIGYSIRCIKDLISLAELNTDSTYNITYTSTTFLVNVLSDGGGTVTERGICWSTSTSPSLSDNKLSDSGTGAGQFTVTINELEEVTRYYARPYAINEAGISYGEEISFYTPSINGIFFNPDLTYGSVTDRDGNTYRTIEIGNQVWMAENLKVTRTKGGASIQYVTGDSNWAALSDDTSSDAYCWYNDDEDTNKDLYGALYTYGVARSVCPTGWHLPMNAEWIRLEDYLIDNGYNWDGTTEGDKVGKSLASAFGWDPHSNPGSIGNDPSSNNASGFTALPGGYRRDDNGLFSQIHRYGVWWSSKGSLNFAISHSLGYDKEYLTQPNLAMSAGFSIRCIKDSEIWFGSLQLDMQNASDLNPNNPGSNGTVNLLSDIYIIESANTDTNGEVFFTNLEQGENYQARFYYDAGLGAPYRKEYWGKKELVIFAGETQNETFIRNMPFISEGIKVYDGDIDVTGTLIEVGTELNIKVKVLNERSGLHGRTKLFLDQDKAINYDFEEYSADQIMYGNGQYTEFTFTYTPILPGDYYYAIYTQANLADFGGYVVTDSWGWSETPLFSIP